jgi:TRAP-type C4-dicarboxylate transport system substrate-binding protein
MRLKTDLIIKQYAIFAVLMIFCLYFSPNATAKDKVITWKVQTIYSPGSSPYIVAEDWAKEMEKITNGKLKLKLFPPGALSPILETVTFLEKGVYDVAFTFGPFFTGFVPEGDIEAGIPFAWEHPDEVYDAMENRGLVDLIREAYIEHNIVYYPYIAEPYYNYLTNFEINNIDSFKGKKIRALGIWGKLTQKLGASPVTIPGPEVYQALQLGTIDGAIYGWSSLEDNKLSEVVKYNIYPSAAVVCGSMLINKKSMESLPADLQAIVHEATRSLGYSFPAFSAINRIKKNVKNLKNKGDIIPVHLSEDDMKKIRNVVKELWDELAAKSPRMKKCIEILKTQSEDLGRPII